MTRSKVLINTAWWPSKTRWFSRYAAGIVAQLEDPSFDKELLIATNFAQTKFISIVRSMMQGQQWAEHHLCSHVLNVEADKVLPAGAVARLLSHKKPVVFAGDRQIEGEGLERLSPHTGIGQSKGWGVVLVETPILALVPFDQRRGGGWFWPDRLWFKKLDYLGIEAWIDHDCSVETLEPAAKTPAFCFDPSNAIE
jgi:hypothetical protein